MWVDTGTRLVNIRDADTIDIVREIGDVRGGDRDAWTFLLIATFGERQEILASVTTYPPRDAQALDDFGGSARRIHALKSLHTQAATDSCTRCLRTIATALSEGLHSCSLEGLTEDNLDPLIVERDALEDDV